jgi:RNA polymerase sigma-70 factor (family 1)
LLKKYLHCNSVKKPENIRLLQQAIACFDDTQAYKQLFLLFYPSLVSFAVSIIKSREVSEEIVSDVFVKIWEKRHQLDKVENLSYYLFTAVKNKCLNQLNNQKNKVGLEINDTVFEFKSLYHDPEQKMISAEMISQIQKAIQELPPRCRLIFKLVKEEGLKYKEAAQLMQLSVKTIENQMSLAFKKIGTAINFKHPHFTGVFSKN